MRFVAGIDPSITNTGAVVLDELGNFVGAYNSSAVKKSAEYDGGGSADIALYAARARGVAEFIKNTVGDHGVELVGYEDYSYGSIHFGMSLAEFGGILKHTLSETVGANLLLKSPTSVKKFASGNGSAGKQIMVSQALAECPALGENPTSDVCDAYFLAKLAWYAAFREQAAAHETNRDALRLRLDIASGKVGKAKRAKHDA